MAKKKKPGQGTLFESTAEPRWTVITTEKDAFEVHELRHSSTGKLAHERADTPGGLERLRKLADLHNARNLMPRGKIECAADIGGSVEAALKAQTKAATRRQDKEAKERKQWHVEFHQLCADAGLPSPTEEVIDSWRAGGTTAAAAFNLAKELHPVLP